MDFDFKQPAPSPDTLETCHDIIKRLWLECQAQNNRLLSLQEQVNINSSNSSKPPSSDSIKNKTKKTKERDEWRKRTLTYWGNPRQGAQPGHKGIGRFLVAIEEVDEVIPCEPVRCCSACLGEVKITQVRQRKQIFEIHHKLHITEYQIYGGRCTSCKKTSRGCIPKDAPSGILGPQALAKIGILTGKYRLSKREVKSFLKDFYGLDICIGTVSNAEKIISLSIKSAAEEIGEAITAQEFLHVDETGHYNKGILKWLWVASNDELTYFKIYKNRSQSCAKALISEDFDGMIITDRHGAYNWIKQEKRQYCWAHLKRDFKKITESVNKDEALIGYKLVDSLKSLFYYWRHLQDGDYYKYQIKRATRNMYSVLRQGKKLLGSKTGKFCAKLLRERKSLWHFLKNDKISPTNNHAERQVRHAVIWRKKCYGTQSARGELFVERILTVLKTCQQKSKNIFEFISRSVRSTWCGDTHPSLVT